MGRQDTGFIGWRERRVLVEDEMRKKHEEET
jgi:hypothetical protein